MKKIFFVLLMSLMSIILMAQNTFALPNPFTLNNTSTSLFNPYKLKMSHSMGFAAGTSSNGFGFYESRYTNHLNYQFNPKLELGLDLNFINYGSTTIGKGFNISSNDDNQSRILPEFSLKWKPSDSVTLQIEYRSYNNFDRWFERQKLFSE